MRKPLISRGRLAFFAASVVCLFGSALSGQQLNSNTNRFPLVLDSSSRHVVFSRPANNALGIMNQGDPRFLQQFIQHNSSSPRVINKKGLNIFRNLFGPPKIQRDWAVSLGAGGVAQGMYPAKYTFNFNAPPSCANDYVVFPINTVTGATRATFGSYFSAATTGSTTLTITPAGQTGVPTTFTEGATNTGTTFIGTSAVLAATNLAAAINRNVNSNPLFAYVAVATGATINVYALTPGANISLNHSGTTLTNFPNIPAGTTGWTAPNGNLNPTTGTDGTQANIVGLNQLYSGGTPACLADPKFIFSYASGVGPVVTSPTISYNGTKIAYVENDPNIGAILHILTFASGPTEIGATATTGANCVNTGAAAPTCATDAVIPGSTTGSTATDFMLPLGLLAANATTGAQGATDTFSSPFINYGHDTLLVGDDNGYLYSITPAFNGTPAFAGGNFPVQLNTATTLAAPTAVTATTTVVTVTVANALTTLQSVTIWGVTANGANCTAADVAAINGTHIVATATGAHFTFNAAIPTATAGAGCTLTAPEGPGGANVSATVTTGINVLSPPSVDGNITGNIFVGDSSANMYEVTSAGVLKNTASLGENLNGGVRVGPIIDSGNLVGYAVSACDNSGNLTGGEAGGTTNAALWQFSFTSTTLTKVAGAELDTNGTQGCSGVLGTNTGFPTYDPTPDARYYLLGISSATAANNGEIIAAASGTGGQQIKTFQFVSSALQTTPEGPGGVPAKPQIGTNNSPISPVTEFFNSQAFAVSAVTASHATNIVTVTTTAANSFVVGDLVVISGVAANLLTGCNAADVNAINGGIYTVAAVNSTTQFTFNATVNNTTVLGCTVTNAYAGADYMFMGVNVNPTELYSFTMPGGVLISGVNSTPIIAANNTASVSGGTSGIVVDNDGIAGQEASIYYGTLATSTGICGTTVDCAVKLTENGLN